MKVTKMLILAPLCVLLFSCDGEDPPAEKQTGLLSVHIGMEVVESDTGPAGKAAPSVEEFGLTIYQATGTPVLSFERVADMPEAVELNAGDYYVEAYSQNMLPAAFEHPYFSGISELFTIESNAQSSVHVLCSLGNCIVTVAYSPSLQEAFETYSTQVSSDLGSLTFDEQESRRGYFQPLPLSILVSLTYNKPDGSPSSKSLTGSIPMPEAGKHYALQVDASIDAGMASFQLLLDSTTTLELVEITGGGSLPPEGPVAYGDLLITEVMANPTALSDVEGEWFEVYNNSGAPIDMQNLVIRRDDTNEHVFQEDLVLDPGAFLVLQRTSAATSAPLSYIYGSALTLTNSGAVLEIYNADANDGPGTLIWSLDYGQAGFPEGSGASMGLDPGAVNTAGALLPSNWCVSTTAYESGDLGTPGEVNNNCQ